MAICPGFQHRSLLVTKCPDGVVTNYPDGVVTNCPDAAPEPSDEGARAPHLARVNALSQPPTTRQERVSSSRSGGLHG